MADDIAVAVVAAVSAELDRARSLFGPMASPHEGIAVIREEYLELEELVFRNDGNTPAAVEEAVQLAAMALRYVVDLDDGRAAS